MRFILLDVHEQQQNQGLGKEWMVVAQHAEHASRFYCVLRYDIYDSMFFDHVLFVVLALSKHAVKRVGLNNANISNSFAMLFGQRLQFHVFR